jgi:hypothetical protein
METNNNLARPYGAANDLNAHTRKSPCIDYFYPEFPGIVCQVFAERREGRYATLPEACNKCEKRLAYVAEMDPQASRSEAGEERKQEMEKSKKPVWVGNSESAHAVYMRARKIVVKLGYKTVLQAVLEMRNEEGMTIKAIASVINVSPPVAAQYINKAEKKYGSRQCQRSA